MTGIQIIILFVHFLYQTHFFTSVVIQYLTEHLSLVQNRRSSEIQGTALGKSLWAWTCIYRSMPAGVALPVPNKPYGFCGR